MRAQSYTLLDRGEVPNGTPFRAKLNVSEYEIDGVQWINHSGVGSGQVNLYVALAQDERLVADLDPSANKYWSALPSSPFTTQPTAAAGSDVGPVSGPQRWLLIEVVAAVTLTDFSVLWAGKTQQ